VNSSLAKLGLVLQPEQPVEGQEHGVGNYGSAGLLASSAGRGWSGLAAELRNHSGVIAKKPGPDTEICVDVHGGHLSLRGRGTVSRTAPSPSGEPSGFLLRGARTVWLRCPILCRQYCISIFLQANSRRRAWAKEPIRPRPLRCALKAAFRTQLSPRWPMQSRPNFSVRHLWGACSSKRWRRAWRRGWPKTTSAHWRAMSPPVQLRQDLIDAD
jgi:hypothetical protein